MRLTLRSSHLYGAGNVSLANMVETFSESLRVNRVFLLFVVLFPVRWVLIAMGRAAFHPVWDSLLVGALAFYVGCLLLNLNGPYSYYFSSGDYAVVLALFGLLLASGKQRRWVAWSGLAMLAINLPATVGFAIAEKELSKQNEALLDFTEGLLRTEKVYIQVVAENSWPAWGMAAQRQRRQGELVSGR